MVRGIARSFKTFEQFDDLEAELLMKLADLKSSQPDHVEDWKSFLAVALFNAAKDCIRKYRNWTKRAQSLESQDNKEDIGNQTWEDRVPGQSEADPDFLIEWEPAWADLDPELKNLWQILMEEEGSITNTALRLNLPRKTVEYWIKTKLAGYFKKKGFE